MPGQESSQMRSAQRTRSYEGMETVANPTAALRSWRRWSSTLFDYPVRALEHRWRDRQLECLGRLQIYNQLELRRLLDREVGGLGTFQYLVHVDRGAPKIIYDVGRIGHETPGIDKSPHGIRCRQPVLGCQLCDALSLGDERGASPNNHRIDTCPGHVGEGPVGALGSSHVHKLKPHACRLRRDLCSLQDVPLRRFGEDV